MSRHGDAVRYMTGSTVVLDSGVLARDFGLGLLETLQLGDACGKSRDLLSEGCYGGIRLC